MTMRRTLMATTVLLATSVAWGAETTGFKWPNFSLHFSTGDLSNTGPGGTDWEAAFATGAQRWSDRLTLQVTTDNQTLPQCGTQEGPNTTFFSTDICGGNWGGTTLGISRTIFFSTGPRAGEAVHNEILFNANQTWSVYDGPWQGANGDLTRVAVHEMGHSAGLDHTLDPTAIMWPLAGGTIDPQTDDIVGLNGHYGANVEQLVSVPDLNFNGWNEVGVVTVDPNTGANLLQIREGRFDQLMTSIDLGTDPLLSLTITQDASGNNKREIAAVGRRPAGTIRTQMFDTDTGQLISKSFHGNDFSGIDAIGLGDTDGDSSPEVGVLGVNVNDRARVQLANVADGSIVRQVSFNQIDRAVAILAVPDLDGDSIPEIALLAVQPNGKTRVQVRSALTGNLVSDFFTGTAYDPIDFALIDDLSGNAQPEIAVLEARDSDGKIRVTIKDAFTGVFVINAFFGTNDEALAVMGLDDVNGGGSPDFAVLIERGSDGAAQVKVKDGATNALIKKLTYAPVGQPLLASGLSDQDGAGGPDILVFGNDAGQFLSMMKDALTGDSLNRIQFP